MLGIIAWLVAGVSSFNQDVNEKRYGELSYKDAVECNDPYYYDGKGKKYLTKTGEQVYLTTQYYGKSIHQVLRSVKTNALLYDITEEKMKDAEKRGKEEAKEKGEPFYRYINTYHRYEHGCMFKTFDTEEIFGCYGYVEYFPSNRNKIYKTLIPDRTEGNLTFYQVDPYGDYYVYFDEEEEWKRLTWREYKKLFSFNGYYTDPNGDIKIKENGKVYHLVYSTKDDLAWGLEYKNEKNHLMGIKRFWRLYENEDGSFTRETKWYHNKCHFLDGIKRKEVDK